ncbi:MAG: adenylate/guanylate cyclase domain-containing protein [Burkholderiales bacterium]|nr:adenylate/guanylate cyclase domain-containing protein [Burkholderiales bacterium]
MKQHLARIALGLAVVALFAGHAVKLYRIGFVSQLDNIIYDYRLRLTAPGGVDPRIVILDIDEKSLADPALGRWPWGRDKMAAIVERLFDHYGIAVLGVDVVNPEPDTSSGLGVLESLAAGELKELPEFRDALARLRPSLDHDGRLAGAVKGRPVVLGYYFNFDEGAREAGKLPPPVLPAGTFTGRNIAFLRARGFGANLPAIQDAAPSAGHFNPAPDFDGVTRRVPMLVEYKGATYEALSLALVRLLIGSPGIAPGYAQERFLAGNYSGLEWLEVGPLRIPVDENVAALVPYRGPRGSFAYFSLADIYHARVPAEALKGKIALLGTTTPSLFDLRAAPVGEVYPGVEIHANLVAGILDGAIKHKPAYMWGGEVLLLVVLGVGLAVLVPMLSPLRATVVSAATVASVTALSIALWSGAGIVLPLASVLLMTLGIFALNMSYGYFVESRSKRQITERFGEYVPPELADQMARDPAKYTMEGRSETLTVLFSDIRGFTTISEGMEPTELRRMLNEYLTEMSLVIRGNRGTLDKYIGDAIMAFWGAPVADPGHATRAVETGMAMQARLAELAPAFRAKGWPELAIGVGVNTGPMYVGDMGSRIRRAYTVIGDAVNTASRLEGLTKRYGVGVLVGEETRRHASGIVFRELDRVRVKGKDEPVAIFEPLGREGAVPSARLEEAKLWAQALKLYRAQSWEQAELALFNLDRLYPGTRLYPLYAERVRHYRAAPPGPGWDGATTFEEK